MSEHRVGDSVNTPDEELVPISKRKRAKKPLWRRLLTSILRVGVAAYLGLALILTSCQSHLVYHPSEEIIATPDEFGMEYDDVRFIADDDVELSGWYVKAKRSPARGVVLFCHGNAGNISGRISTLDDFRRLGLDVFIFDYRGYGLSDGKPTEKGTYLDAAAAWTYLTETRGVVPAEIIIFGRSLGGAIAAHLGKNREPAGVILESTFTSVPALARHYYPYMPTGLLIRFDYDTLEYVKGIQRPILIGHSPDDTIIPFQMGRDVLAAANEPKTFLTLRGGHNQATWSNDPANTRAVKAFVDSILTPVE